jgi:hypothetical protein
MAAPTTSAGSSLLKLAGDIISAAKDLTGTSLTLHTRRTVIPSRAYIDDRIAREDVTANVLRAAHTFYISIILTAIRLQHLVTDGHTVSDLLSVVATESLEEPMDDIASAFGRHQKGELPDAALEADMAMGEGKEVRFEGDYHLPLGKVIDVTLGNPEDPKSRASILLTVQMLPYVVAAATAVQFITAVSSPSLKQRYMMWRAGEISFWSDFVFQMDRLKKRNKASMDPAFSQYLDSLTMKDVTLFDRLFFKGPRDAGRNLANCVMVLSAEAVEQAKADANIDLHNKADRARYFTNSYAMMVFVVDVTYSRVTVYISGLDQVGNYSFDQFKQKKKDDINLLEVLTNISKAQMPRF